MRAFVAILLATCLTQEHRPPSTSAAEVMEKVKVLEFLVGEWEGEGTYEFGPDQKTRFKATETVTPKVGGKAVLIEVRGVSIETGQEVVVYEGLAVLTWDSVSDKYVCLPVTAREGYVQAHVEVGEKKVVWGFDDPRGPKIRFTITVSEKGQWSEIGESSVDAGKEWHRFMDMTLNRKK